MVTNADGLRAYYVALGKVLRDARLRAGLSGDAFAGVVTRANLQRIESGSVQIRFGTLVQLCRALNLDPAHVVLAVESRLSETPIEQYSIRSFAKLSVVLRLGALEPMGATDVTKGIKGQRSDQLRQAVQNAKASGLSNKEIARNLNVSIRTVERYLRSSSR